MNVQTLAKEIGTEPRILRRYLRTTRDKVGSGARYVFTPEELTTIRTGFAEWAQGRRIGESTPAKLTVVSDRARDLEVWEEEEKLRAERGRPSVAQQLREMRTNPRARAAALRAAEERVRVLEDRLYAAGLHITQMRAS